METAYYVTHPMIDRTAVVFAPSTEKARTTFLDWLERNNLIRRSDRQNFRADMVAQRLDDPGVPSDVELHYGYRDYTSPMRYPTSMYGKPQTPQPQRPTREELDRAAFDKLMSVWDEGKFTPPPEIPEEEWTDLEDEEEEEPEPPRPHRRGMPIQQVMLRGYVE